MLSRTSRELLGEQDSSPQGWCGEGDDMTLPMMDGHGNLHHASGPGGGQFAAKAPAPPVAPLASASERLRTRVRVNWQHLLDPDGANTPVDIPGDSRRKRDGLSWFRRGGGRAPNSRAVATKSFVTSVSIPTYTSEHAPVTITVDGAASGDEVAREYRTGPPPIGHRCALRALPRGRRQSGSTGNAGSGRRSRESTSPPAHRRQSSATSCRQAPSRFRRAIRW